MAIFLVKAALPIWDEYTEGRSVQYRDSVVGIQHFIAPDLLQRGLNAVEQYMKWPSALRWDYSRSRVARMLLEFRDPWVSLQDLDMEWPEPVTLTFYAVYNLLEHLMKPKRTFDGHRTIYVAINQALDALEKCGRSKSLPIEDCIAQA